VGAHEMEAVAEDGEEGLVWRGVDGGGFAVEEEGDGGHRGDLLWRGYAG